MQQPTERTPPSLGEQIKNSTFILNLETIFKIRFYRNLSKIVGINLDTDELRQLSSSEEQAKIANEYRNQIGLGASTTFSADAFTKLNASRINTFEMFKETKDNEGTVLSKRIKTAQKDNTSLLSDKEAQEKSTEFKEKIKENLTFTPDTTQAQADYEESIETFRKLAKEIPYKYKVQDLIHTLAEINSNAVTALKAQHTQEIEKFSSENFKILFAQTLNIEPNDPNFIATHANLIKDLETSHKKQVTEFEKSTTDALNSVHSAAEQEMKQLSFIANLHKNNKYMRLWIEQLAAKNEKNKGNQATTLDTEPGIDLSEDQLKLTGVTVSELGTIRSLTHKEIQKDANGAFILEVGSYLGDLRYHLDPRQNFKADLLLMAQAVRASGYKNITMSVNFSNPELAKEKARDAYEAARLAGYPADQIKIMVNNKEMKRDEVFADYPEQLTAIETKANQLTQEVEQLTKVDQPATAAGVDSFKKDMNELRAQNKAQQQAAQVPPSPPALASSP